MKNPGSRKRSSEGTFFWISFSDLMTTLAILFMFMVASSLLEIHAEQEQRNVIKKQIVEDLVDKLGQKYPVEIERQTGAITISDGILFGFDETSLTEQGKEFLKGFVPDYTDILLSNEKNREYVAQVIVEGHADNVGSYEINMEKSLGRAYTVAAYIFNQNEFPGFPYRENLKAILTANGRSNMDQKETAELSRRVEFKFRLKDWDLMNTKIGAEFLGAIENGI